MKLNPKTWLATMAAIAIVAAGWNLATSNSQETRTSSQIAVPQTEQVARQGVSITINPGSDSQVLSVQNLITEDGSTALDITRLISNVETSGEGEMAFVTSIDGRVADQAKNEFWELIINGAPSQVGAGSYTVQEGDTIEWRISTF
jgi:hypothetical protein